MITIHNNSINYFHLFKALLNAAIDSEIQLVFSRPEIAVTYSKTVEDVSVDEYLSFYLIGFEEVENADQTDGEVDLAFNPGEWNLDVQQWDALNLIWVNIYSDICKVIPRTITNNFPNL